MNPYIFPVCCDVCGEEGMARPCDAGAAFLGGIRHSDPEICANNLRIKARKLEEREKALKEKEQESC